MKRMQNYPLLGIALVIGLIFIVMPLTLDLFRLNLIGKYLTYAFVAVVLIFPKGLAGLYQQ
ncbi:urea ABC transporter permease subunit UrtC, partial [Klebsiella pneumoniae]